MELKNGKSWQENLLNAYITVSIIGYFVEERNGVPPPEKIEFGKEVKEDLNSDPEDDPTHFIAILVESLYMLRKIPEAAEVGFDL